MTSRIIAVVIVLLAIGLIGYGVYAAFKTIYKPAPAPKTISLLDYLGQANTEVKLTIEGPITANENHNSQAMAVTTSSRAIDMFRGYTDTPIISQNFPNNQTAFEDFVRALQNAGFTRTSPNANASSTELGLCPQGQRYVYQLFSGSTQVLRAWSTSCNDRTTFQGNTNTIINLFEAQIPDFDQLTNQANAR
jgi:hypothetical protein